MAIVSAPENDGDQLVHLNVPWELYQTLVTSLGDDRHVRLTYDGVTLEIMSPGRTHEFYANRISALIEGLVIAWQIDLDNTGQTTFGTKPIGFEADGSYYIANAGKVDGVGDINLSIHPPPDLVVEVDITHRNMDKEQIYANIGVTEFWRYDHEGGFQGFEFVDGGYVKIAVSRVFSGLPLREIAIRLNREEGHLAVMNDWHRWLHENRHLHRCE